jgi:hypothetical protein
MRLSHFSRFLSLFTHSVSISVTRGRCYDDNYLIFSTIFGKQLAFFSKKQRRDNFLQKLAVV